MAERSGMSDAPHNAFESRKTREARSTPCRGSANWEPRVDAGFWHAVLQLWLWNVERKIAALSAKNVSRRKSPHMNRLCTRREWLTRKIAAVERSHSPNDEKLSHDA